MSDLFVGRAGPRARLTAALDEALTGRRARFALVSGEAGMGKTALLTRLADEASGRDALVAWGTGWAGTSAPAFWIWTQVLRVVLAGDGDVASDERDELARLVPELGSAPADDGPGEHARFRLFDAVVGVLERAAARRPLVVITDDLQWADESSLLLFEFLVRPHRPVPLLVLGAYRHHDLADDARARLAQLTAAEVVRLEGLSLDDVREMLAAGLPEEVAAARAPDVHRRTGGHPFFVRELAHLAAEDPDRTEVPVAVRDAVRAHLRPLGEGCRRLLEGAAVAGKPLPPDVLAEISGTAGSAEIDEAVTAGVLRRHRDGRVGFVHDIFREAISEDIAGAECVRLHQRCGTVLEGLPDVEAGEVARHFVQAVPADGPDRAVRWSLAAADADRRRLAFAEAAGHLRRAREAVAGPDSGAAVADLLVAEADAIARAGRPDEARRLLAEAHSTARRLGDAARLAAVALGLQSLGARFAMPRDETIAVLEEARSALTGRDPGLEARVTAGLAREFHHSIPAQRPKAGPLSEEALAIARTVDDPAALAGCLLARHDILWIPGHAAERADVARELVTVAERLGDAERRCEGLLLVANALLEAGSPAFRPVLSEFLEAAEALGQPRHTYMALTRRGALALMDGRIDEGEHLAEEAAALGDRIGEPDTGNVRMSQRLEVVRAGGDPERLAATAQEAVRWWVGVPSYAYAVAAGFFAQAGDLAAARRSLDTVIGLDQWREDRSYLWSVFMGQLATAAIALDDHRLCEELLAEIAPLAEACAVNGAVVCFMGVNAHWAGVLAAALGRTDEARAHLSLALGVHERLGARAWEASTRAELARLDAVPDAPAATVLSRNGSVWELRYTGRVAHLRDAKGLRDLATLVARPAADVHVLELTGRMNDRAAPDAVLDASAREQYRRRLAELDQEIEEAQSHNDLGRQEHAEAERDALIEELKRATGLGGRDRGLGGDEAERARKAVGARLRDAIKRVEEAFPELGRHLDRSILTGTYCRYQPETPMNWEVRS